MKVVFLAPQYPAEMPHFTRALAEAGAEVIGVGDAPLSSIAAGVRHHLARYIQVDSLFDEERAASDLHDVLVQLRPDRIESLWEPLVLLAGRLRDEHHIGGMTRDQVLGFRDKSLMKQRIEAAGLRVPRFATASTADEVRHGATKVGYPCVVKPISGAGSRDTYPVHDDAQLEQLLPALRHVRKVSVEEYVEGDEFTYDAISIDGVPVFDSVAQYFPKPIESRSTEWISPAQVVYRDPHIEAFEAGVELGRGVLRALGMGTGFTHMEWFRRPDGEVVFGEIAVRAPGAKLVDQMNYANDFDAFRGWAQAVCHGQITEVAQRRYHVACVFKRAQGRGRIARIAGRDELRASFGPHLVEDNLLPIGHERRDWISTLLSDGWMIVRHPDLATTMDMMDRIVTDLQMWAS